MTKSTKIMLAVIGSVLAVCIALTAGVSISKSQNDTTSETTLQSGEADTANSDPAQSSTTTTQPVKTLNEEILGKWSDSTQMSGYEFFADGSVNLTYVNLTVPVLNFPINGTAKGTYTLNGSDLTVKFSIYSKTIEKNFTASVENNTLSLYDKEDRETGTYERVLASSSETTSSSQTSTDETGLCSTWVNSDGSIKYTFNENLTLSVSYTNAQVSSISSSVLNGTYSGVYMTNGDKITVQYMVNSQKVTQEFTYAVSGASLSLKDEDGDTTIMIRNGGSSSNSSNSIIGKWTDSTAMSGYDFKDGGNVDITYVNFTVPVINMPINGTYSGSYKIEADKITISASIYSKSVVNTYTYSVDGNTLTLTNTEDGSISTYTRQ